MYSVVMLVALSSSAETVDFGRRGCRGCFGGAGCVGNVGCHGCRGACWGCNGCVGWTACHGCMGTVHHACHGCNGVPAPAPAPAPEPEPEPEPVYNQQGARIVVTLPTPARLMIDNYTVPTVSNRHIYQTAAMRPGETRSITFRAQIDQQMVTKQVTVSAGQQTTVELTPTGVAAAAR